MFKRTKLFSFMLLLVLSLALVACGGADDGATDTGDTSEEAGDSSELLLDLGQENLSVPYVAWARETISTHLLAAILEDVGYNVEVKQVEAGPMFAGVAEGTEDFHTSAWLPATHASYWEEYGDDLVQVTEVLDKAPLALTVPSYVEDINSIEDLKDNEEFGEAVNWEIIGIDPGAGIMQNTQTVIEEYGLDNWTVVESSEAAMLTTLREKIENEEPVIVPLWKPHWIFGVEDLKMLEDPKEIYGGEGDQIYTVARKGLEEDAPAAYRILENYVEDYDLVEELMPLVHDEGQDPADVAREFLENNPDKLAEWTEGVRE
ncbi:MAG TPA: glycine betaine ABC transporter substrate-binding protein [Pseudogracilibacillus sp.]|nr:glycine betaine ABC transporter substrate-binding protein [Pseudogracilibacillus sp.]